MTKESAGTGNGKKKKCCRGWWWKLPLTLLLVLVVLLVIVYIRLDPIATSVANSQLPKILNTDASVERIDVKLLDGFAEIYGLRIQQPEGFGDGALVELDRVMAKIDLGSLGGEDLITIETIELDGLEAHIVKNEDGVLNVTRLGPPPSDTSDAPATIPEAEAVSDEAGAEEDKEPFPGIRINSVAIQGVVLSFADESGGEGPLKVSLGDLGIAVTACEVRLGDDIATTLQNGSVTFRDIRVSLPAGERPTELALADLGIDVTGCEILLGDSIGATLQDGRVTLKDISVSQPAGFGDDMLVRLPLLQLDVGTQPFEANVVRLERLALEGLRAHIIRDTNGVMNVMRLAGGGGAAEESESAAEAAPSTEVAVVAPPEKDAPSTGSPVGVYLGELALTDFQVIYADSALADEPMTFTVDDLALRVKDLMAFLSEAPVPTSSVDLSLALDQGDYPPALLDVQASLGPVSAGVPDVNAQIVLSGFMMDTIDPLVPSGVREAAGANGADIHGSVALNAKSIDFEGRVATDAGHAYPILVEGPLSKPEVDLGPIGLAVAGRLAGGVQNLTVGAAGAALDLTQGAASVATDLGEGAVDVVGKVGGGLFGAAKAAMKLDLKGVGDEVTGTVTGVATEATETVGTATSSATDQMAESVDTVKGGKRTSAWLEGIPDRHAEGVEAAAQALPEMPFPPPVVGAPTSSE